MKNSKTSGVPFYMLKNDQKPHLNIKMNIDNYEYSDLNPPK